MPLRLNAGLSKKVGLPNYGSLGASCHVECELDGALLATDPDRFHEHVREVFVACSQAVHDELDRQQSANGPSTSRAPVPHCAAADEAPAAAAGRNGNGHRATAKQLDYAQQLAGHIRGLGVRRLEALAGTMFGKPMADLTSLDASNLIDTLKEIKAGLIDVEAALAGGAA